MTIGKLRQLIAGLPDDAAVLVTAPDHSYRVPRVVAGTALYAPRMGWTEDYGEADTPEKEYGKRTKALLIF